MGVFSLVVYSMIAPLLTNPAIPIYCFVDNLYTSHSLFNKLHDKEVILIGTVNYKMLPTCLKAPFSVFKRSRINATHSYCNDVPVIVLANTTHNIKNAFYTFVKDNSDFCIGCNSSMVMKKGYYKSPTKSNEKQRVGFGVQQYNAFKIVQDAIKLYNTYMNGIDVVDQLISSHNRHQRSTNWHHTYIYTESYVSRNTKLDLVS